MRKMILVLLFLNSIFGLAQNKYDIEQIEKSEDPGVLSDFIVNNYNHPSVPKLKAKLIAIITKKLPTHSPTTPHSSEVKKEEKTQVEKNNPSDTEDILNHLIKDNPSKSNSVYVVIKNLSQCLISVTFTGNKIYTIDITPQSLSRVLLDKGHYNISSKICNAKYNADKDITNDFEMSLNNVITTKKQ